MATLRPGADAAAAGRKAAERLVRIAGEAWRSRRGCRPIGGLSTELSETFPSSESDVVMAGVACDSIDLQ